MAKKQSLFELIQSLTKSEKRYLKLELQKFGSSNGSNFELMYNEIEKSNLYREEKLKRDLKLSSKNLHFTSTKNKLNALILKSMNNFHAPISIEAEISDKIRNIEFLVSKRLYSQAMNKLVSAKKMAYRNERYNYIQELLYMEIEISKQRLNILDLNKSLKTLSQEFDNIIQLQAKYIKTKYLYNRMFFLFKTIGYARSERISEMYKKLIPTYSKSDLNSSSKSSYFFGAFSSMIYHTAHGNVIEYHDIAYDLYQMSEKYPFELKRDQGQLIEIIYHYAIACFINNKDSKVNMLIKQLEEISPKLVSDKYKLIEMSSNLQFEILLRRKKMVEAKSLFIEMTKYSKDVIMNKEFKLLWYEQFTRFHLELKDYKKALYWNNKVLNSDDLAIRQDIRGISKIHELIIHLKLNNTELLRYKIKNFKQMLIRKETMYKTERLVIEICEKSLSGDIKQNSFKNEVIQKLENLKSDKFENLLIHRFRIQDTLTKVLEKRLD